MQKLSTEWGYSAPAAASLVGKLNYFAVIDTDGKIAVAGDGVLVVGTITEEAVAGASATFSTGFILKAVCAEAIDHGAKVASDTNGKAVNAASGDYVVGVAINETTMADQLIEILALHAGRAA